MEINIKDLTIFFVILVSGITPINGDCEAGWYSYYDTCYYITGDRHNMNDLMRACTLHNATLWSAKSSDEITWVKNIIKNGPRILYWTGLKLVNKRWTWVDGTSYNKATIPWYRDTEGNKNDANNLCVGMYSYDRQTGQFQARRCRDGWGTICTRPKAMLDICDLENGWRFLDGRCLKHFKDKQTWQEARQICQSKQGDLSIFKNYDQLLALNDLLTCRLYNYTAWIGLSDTVKPKTWQWINNDTTRYQRWYPYANQFKRNGSSCAATDPAQGWSWRNYDCNARLNYICNRSVGVCPTGWLQNLDRCYQPNSAGRSLKTWFDAKLYCMSMGTSLLTINSDAEQQFISKTLSDLHIDKSWIGLSDEMQSDVLSWVDGTNVSYKHWANSFPQPMPNRFDCGTISRGSSDSRWATGYCFNMNAFICEMKVTSIPLNTTTPPVTMHCDPNWQLFRDKCYYFGPIANQTQKNWQDARDFCAASGNNGHLVIIGDAYEMSYITVQQLKNTVTWIGMKYDAVSQQLRWVDGTLPGQQAANETNFYPGEPDDIKNGQQCIQIVGGRRDYTGTWDDGDCHQKKSFICEKDAYQGASNLPTTPTVPSYLSPQCGGGWVYNSGDNFCYQVVLNSPKTWALARSDCVARGGDLMSISGQREQNFLEAMLSAGQFGSVQLNYWIGATDQTREGGWEWTDGSPFRLLHWYPGEPNNYLTGTEPENCAEIVPGWNYQWNDRYCSKEQLYICKKNPVVSTMTGVTPPSGTPPSGKCIGQAMVSGNYSVATQAFSASSSIDPQHLPYNSRYFPNSNYGGWTAKTSDFNQYIAVSFYNTIVVTGITTTGRPDNSQWVTQYKILYSDSYYADWLTYEDPPGTPKIFTANNDSQTAVTNNLLFPFEAKGVKLVPVKWHYGISLRLEILGCLSESCSPDYAISGPLVVNDTSLTASSSSDMSHNAASARVRPVTIGKTPSCWKPQTDDTNQWIQVDLENVMIIWGITTKGNPYANEWVTSYTVKYAAKDVASQYVFYQEPYGQVFYIYGNTDNVSPYTYYFKMHMQARYIRIIPDTWNTSIALAFDVLVCNTGCHGVPLISGTKSIPDDQITASTVHDSNHAPSRSRLNQASHGPYGGAWIPTYNDLHQYIQVDLGFMVHVSAIATQGSFDSQDWVTTYKVTYSEDAKSWASYYGITSSVYVFKGNWENKISRKQYMLLPFIARYVRIWPQSWHSRIAMRLEIYGCPGSDSGTKIGCFADNAHNRDLPFEPFTDPRVGMWPPMCVHHCFRKGFYYAGIQDQFKCFCGNTYGRYGPANDCNLSCVPKTNFLCGGPSSNQVYTTGLTSQFKICPPGWKNYLDQCYMLLTDTKSWYDAQADCHMLGGALTSPNDQHQQDFVMSLLQGGDGFHAWIGFNDIQEESFFQWANGRQVKYTNWGINQPSKNGNNQQDCVRMDSKTGGWQSDTCDSVNQYVCQRDKMPSTQPSQATRVQGCPAGWTAYRATCYLVADALRTWAQAKSVCVTLGGNLVRIRDRYEQAYVASVLGSHTGTTFWSTMTSLGHPGTFQYDWGTSKLAFTNWGTYQPAGSSSNEMCVSLGGGSNAGLWYSNNCTIKLGGMCEKRRVGHYTTPSPPPTPPTPPACDPGLIQTKNACYQLNEPRYDKKSWDEARLDCAQKGGDLASFHSMDELTAIGNTFKSPYGESIWIGLNDRNRENSFTWSDNSPVNFGNYNPGEPNDFGGKEDCITMNRNLKWNDESCGTSHSWLCMVPRGGHLATVPTVPIPTAGPSGMCQGNWTFWNNNCYKYVPGVGDKGTSWRSAHADCLTSGADLISVKSKQENLFMFYVLLKESNAFVWIGLSEITDVSTGYRWSDRSPVAYTNWNPGEPNDWQGQEDCAGMWRGGKWHDSNCGARNGYVCKKFNGSLPTPAPPTMPWSGYCPAGYHQLNDRCYRVFTDRLVWGKAFEKCRNIGPGYTLASVRSDVENAFLVTLLAEMHVSPWIGLKAATYGAHDFLWINNDDNTYTNFALGQPSGGSEQCVQIYGGFYQTGQWNDRDCSIQLPYVCMVRRDSYITTPEPVPSVCDQSKNQKQFMSNCYVYVNTPMTWQTASANCQTQGAALTSITSYFEESYIYILSKQNNQTPVWIGLNDIQNSGYYSWSDSWPVTYTHWQNGEPNKGPGEGCVLFNSTGRWLDTACNTAYPFVCKISSATPTLTPLPPNGKCDQGWAPFAGKCYFIGQQRTFLDADHYCRRFTANLVSVHNATVNQYLVQAFNSTPSHTSAFWTSLYKSLDAGFAWADGSPLQYTNWKPGEPNNFAHGPMSIGENCMEVQASNGQWNDEFCSAKRDFICEKPISVDNSNNHPGRTQMISIPTPIPQTKPSALPPQVTPTLPAITGVIISNTPPVGRPTVSYPTPYVNHHTQSPPTPRKSGSSSKVSPPQSKSTQQTQTGGSSTKGPIVQSQTGNNSNGSKMMSGGAIAGIVVGSLLVGVIAGGGVILWRRKMPASGSGSQANDGAGGFENQIYYDTSKQEVRQKNGMSDESIGLRGFSMDASES